MKDIWVECIAKKVSILQSNYIPWIGYFDMIAAVDEFIIYDDAQYTRRDWRNRNRIKTSQGLQWLTVPVFVKGKFTQKIRDTNIDGTNWAVSHWKALVQNYSRAVHFEEIAEIIKPIYFSESFTNISQLNRRFIEVICHYLKIKTVITSSWDYALLDGKTERLANLCLQAGATEYVSGPSAQSYLDEELFSNLGMKITWFDYTGYKRYPQLWGGFTPNVSILDLLFNCGKNSVQYMKYTKSKLE
jgi:hypothetical protein